MGSLAKLMNNVIFMSTLLVVVLGEDYTHGQCEHKTISSRLTLQCKNWSILPTSIDASVHVLEFNHGGNVFSTLKLEEFKKLEVTDLHKINLGSCEIQNVELGVFDGFKNIREIDLSNNKITSLNLNLFKENKHLSTLKLNNNVNLVKLIEFFPPLLDLSTISIRNCNLNFLSESVFFYVPNIKTLDLTGNSLTSLLPGTLSGLRYTENVFLGANPWNCNCELPWLRDYLKNRGLKNANVVCATPSRMNNRNIEDIDPNEFVCQLKPPVVKVNGVPTTETHFEVDVDSRFSVECSFGHNVKNELSIPRVFWKKDGKEQIITNNNVEIRTINITTTLIIDPIYETDRGHYECVAENLAGTVKAPIWLMLNGTGFIVDDKAALPIGGDDDTVATARWPWIFVGVLGILIIVAVPIVIVLYKRRKREQEEEVKDKAMALFKGSQIIIDDEDPKAHNNGKVATDEVKAPLLLNGSGTLSKNSGIHPNDPSLLPYPLSPLCAATVVQPSAQARRDAFRQQHLTSSSSRPPSVASVSSLPPMPLVGSGYVTLPRRQRIPSWSSSSVSGGYTHRRPLSPTGSLAGYHSSAMTMPRQNQMLDGRSTSRVPRNFMSDRLGLRTTASGGSNTALDKITRPLPNSSSLNAIDQINLGLSTLNRGRVKSHQRNDSATTPSGLLKGPFSFETIEEATDESNRNSMDLTNILPQMQTPTQNIPKYKKKPPPPINLEHMNRFRSPRYYTSVTGQQRVLSPVNEKSKPEQLNQQDNKDTLAIPIQNESITEESPSPRSGGRRVTFNDSNAGFDPIHNEYDNAVIVSSISPSPANSYTESDIDTGEQVSPKKMKKIPPKAPPKPNRSFVDLSGGTPQHSVLEESVTSANEVELEISKSTEI